MLKYVEMGSQKTILMYFNLGYLNFMPWLDVIGKIMDIVKHKEQIPRFGIMNMCWRRVLCVFLGKILLGQFARRI